jgi:hypothetical protein
MGVEDSGNGVPMWFSVVHRRPTRAQLLPDDQLLHAHDKGDRGERPNQCTNNGDAVEVALNHG